MNRADIEKLLGGYATGTLTSEEQQALFAAALEDQELFDALAREQGLRDLLSDPAAKAQLLAALSDTPLPWYRQAALWMTRPVGLGLAAACIAGMAGLYVWQAGQRAPAPVLVAEVKRQEPVQAPAPTPAVEMETPHRAARKPAKRKEAMMAEAPPPAAAEDLRVNSASRRDSAATVSGGGGGRGGSAGALASPQPQAFARSGFVEMSAQMVSVSPVLGYTVLRKREDGEFVQADPADLHAGDTLELRLTPTEDGYVTVPERQITDARVERSKPFDTPPFVADSPGAKEFSVIYTREPGASATTPVSLRITLNYK